MKNFLKKLGKYLVYPKACMIVALVVAALFMPHFAQAACITESADSTTGEPIYTDSDTGAPCEPTTTTTTTTSSSTSTPSSISSSDMVKDLADFLAIMIRFLNSLLWPFLIILGDLMDVDMIIGPGMEGRMIDIYNQVRSLVNIAFVLVLIAVAFYNVLGLGGGEGELAIKTALPKVVLGLVLVNFTLPIGRVLLDVTNVGTNIAFGLPNIVDGYDFAPELENFTNEVCFKGKDPASTTGAMLQYSSKEADKSSVPIQTQFLCADTNEDDKYDALNSIISTTYFSDLNKNNLGLIMAVNMGKIGSLGLLKEGTISSFEDLTVNMIFVTVMFLVFATSYIVMGIVLLTRVVVLWIALALSPLAVLAYVVPQVKEWAGGGGDMQKKVIKHLISPIIMGVTLSFGYLLMDAWNNTAGSSNALGSLAVNNVISAQFLVSGIDDLPKLILAIASVVVVWTGTFAAASDTFAQGITDGIKGFGDQVKSFAMALPMSLPTVGLGVKGEGPEHNVSPMALILAAQSQMSNVSGGGMAMSQLQNLPADTKFLGLNLNPNSLSNSPTVVSNDIKALTEEINAQAGPIDSEKLAKLAERLIKNVANDPSMSSGDKTTATNDFQRAMTLIKEGKQEGLTDLKRTLANHQSNPEKLGLKKEQLEGMQMALGTTKTLAAPAPTTPATPTTPTGPTTTTTTAPAPLAPAVVTSVNGVVGNADFQAARTALDRAATAAPTSADLVKGAADLKAAEAAVKLLNTQNTGEKVKEASEAVNDAIVSVAKLQAMTTDPVIKTNADNAMVELNKLKDKLPAPTPPHP